MNSRRKLIVVLGAGPIAWAYTVRAQQKHAPILIGVLNAGSRKPNAGLLTAFKQTLAARHGSWAAVGFEFRL